MLSGTHLEDEHYKHAVSWKQLSLYKSLWSIDPHLYGNNLGFLSLVLQRSVGSIPAAISVFTPYVLTDTK